MKFSLAVLGLLFASVGSGKPIFKRSKGNGNKQMNGATGTSSGALYFLTNEAGGNFVVAADIGTDGKLTLRQAVRTGGVGTHGDDGGANGPDALFSQGSVKASASGEVLAAVNAGSSTISLFKINPNNPVDLTLIGEPVGSGGEFPISLAIDKAGSSLCALNGGEVNSVSCFKIDKTKGLTPISGTNRSLKLNQTTPAKGPAGSASHVLFSEDGKQLIASIKGDPTTNPPTVGFLATWDIASDGSLSQDFQSVTPGQGGLLPFSMTLIGGKSAVLVTDPGSGFDIFDMSGSNKSSVVPINGQFATCWSSFSKQTGNFYLTDIGTSLVTEVNVDDNLKGTVVNQYAQGDGVATIDNEIASIGGKDFLYILAPNATALTVLSLNAPGKAQNIQKVDIAAPAKSAGLQISASNLQGLTSFVKK